MGCDVIGGLVDTIVENIVLPCVADSDVDVVWFEVVATWDVWRSMRSLIIKQISKCRINRYN